MTKEEMENIIKEAGWTPHLRKRYNTVYLYVARRESGKLREVYLKPVNEAQEMSPEAFTDFLKTKTTRKSA